MKKAICCIVALLLFVTTTGLAEATIDVTQYSLEKLIELRAAIEAEIESRISSATATLQPGKYIVGVDIAEGSYILVGLMDKGPDDSTPQALYSESMEKASKWDYIDSEYLKTDETWRISLTDGMVLEICNGDCAIQEAAPMLFAPD